MKRTVAALCVGMLLLGAGCSSAPTRTPAAGPASTASGPITVATAPDAGAAGGTAVFTPLVASVLAPPVPVPATDGQIHLAYELQVTNAVAQDITVDSITVTSGTRNMLELTAAELPRWMRVFGATAPTTTFGPGQSGLVWLDVVVATEADIPTRLDHAIALTAAEPNPPLLPATMTETVATTEVARRSPIEITPPLAGAGWIDGNGCCAVTAHRGAVSPLNGRLWAPERFAIDYVQILADGRLFTGDKTKVDSYAFFGADVTAVGNGTVVGVVDGLPEQTPGTSPSGLPVGEYGGNHVVLDLGAGHFAFYAHLQPGSLKVKVGDELTAGQVVGRLGNSGNSDVPHLHFHIMDGPDPLAANGLPFVFSTFTLTGTMTQDAIDALTTDGGPAQIPVGRGPVEERARMPLTGDVMTY